MLEARATLPSRSPSRRRRSIELRGGHLAGGARQLLRARTGRSIASTACAARGPASRAVRPSFATGCARANRTQHGAIVTRAALERQRGDRAHASRWSTRTQSRGFGILVLSTCRRSAATRPLSAATVSSRDRRARFATTLSDAVPLRKEPRRRRSLTLAACTSCALENATTSIEAPRSATRFVRTLLRLPAHRDSFRTLAGMLWRGDATSSVDDRGKQAHRADREQRAWVTSSYREHDAHPLIAESWCRRSARRDANQSQAAGVRPQARTGLRLASSGFRREG